MFLFKRHIFAFVISEYAPMCSLFIFFFCVLLFSLPLYDSPLEWQVHPSIITSIPELEIVGVHNRTIIGTNGNNIYCFNTAKDIWEKSIQLPSTRFSAASVSTEDGIYLIGGHDSGSFIADTLLLKSKDDTFTVTKNSLPPLPTPITLAKAAILENTIYLIGGLTKNNDKETFAGNWQLDIKHSEKGWLVLPPLPTGGITQHLVCATDSLFVIGGWDNSNTEPGRDYIITSRITWKLVNGSWKKATSTPEDFTSGSAAPYGRQNEFIILQGNLDMYVKTWSYNTYSDTWTKWGEAPIQGPIRYVLPWSTPDGAPALAVFNMDRFATATFTE